MVNVVEFRTEDFGSRGKTGHPDLTVVDHLEPCQITDS